MIREIRCLCIKTLARIIPAGGARANSFCARTISHRRVEVTVERETVSMLVPGRPADGAHGMAGGKSAPETPRLKLAE